MCLRQGHTVTMANLERPVRWREAGRLWVNRIMVAFVIQALNHAEIAACIQLAHDQGVTPCFIPLKEPVEMQPPPQAALESFAAGLERAKALGQKLARLQLALFSQRLARRAKQAAASS